MEHQQQADQEARPLVVAGEERAGQPALHQAIPVRQQDRADLDLLDVLDHPVSEAQARGVLKVAARVAFLLGGVLLEPL